MRTAQQLIDTIESSGLLPYSTIESLRARADRDDLSADGLTKLLIEAQLLTAAEAAWLMEPPATEADGEAERDFRAALDGLAQDPTRVPGDSAVGAGLSGAWSPRWAAEQSEAASSSKTTTTKPQPPPKPPAKETTESILDAEAGPPDPKARRRRTHIKKARSRQWESPLFLLGAGALTLLVLAGAGLAYLVNRGAGDEALRVADESYKAGSMSRSITEFERFLEGYPYHEGASSARVRLAVARVRHAVETSLDFGEGLDLVQTAVETTEDEPAFNEAQGELAAVLPKIARGLADKAEVASQGATPDDAAAMIAKAEEALTYYENTKYVPRSLRDDSDTEAVRATLARVGRRRESRVDLDKALVAMREATAAGDPRQAYLVHAKLVALRPEVADDAMLAEAVTAATAAERTTIRFVAEETPAAVGEAPSPVETQVALARPRRIGSTGAVGAHAVTYGGVAYGLSADTGGLLWRHPLGIGPAAVEPVAIDDDWLLVDQRRGELLRIEEEAGAVRWRAPLGGESLAPVVVGGRVFAPLASGSLVAIDAASGKRLGRVEFAQGLRSPPAVENQRKRLYVVGAHSCVYTLDAESLACVAVAFTGHSPGSIPAQPTLVGGRLAMVENIGLQACRVRVFDLSQAGDVGKQIAEMRLGGACGTPIIASGRRFAVAADNGEIGLWELPIEPEGDPVVSLATRPAARGEPMPRYLAETPEGLWLGDIGLSRAVASLADSRLVVQVIDDPFPGDLFVAPLRAREGHLLSARRRGAAGLTVAATELRSGRAVWETDIAVPPAGPPRYSADPRGLLVPTIDGVTQFVEPGAIQRGLAETPLGAGPTTPENPAPEVLDGAIEQVAVLAGGESLLARPGESSYVVTSPTPDRAPFRGTLPAKLAAEPAPFGDGWLAPLDLGQVLLLSATGDPLATPFQPPLAPGRKVMWRPVGVGELEGQPVAVLADDVDSVYCVGLAAGDAPVLQQLGAQRLDGLRPETRVAIVRGIAIIGLSENQLGIFPLPGVEGPGLVPLDGRIEWGPFTAGDLAFVVTAKGELLAVTVEGKPRVVWRAKLGEGEPVGLPLATQGRVLVATRQGVIHSFGLRDGAPAEPIDLGQPLGSGPVAYGQRLLAASGDGSLLVIRFP
ncbi:MAG: PQQ-binding-like beta-propeller repeat protein [Lacipirellulaceae bacterium]